MEFFNPALHRRPQESAKIGRIVVGFGELEFLAVELAAHAFPDESNLVFRMLYQIRSTSARITTASTIMEWGFAHAGLDDIRKRAWECLEYCIRLRNTYAHCQWADDKSLGLYYTDLENSADRVMFEHDWKHVDVALLEKQEAFLIYTRKLLFHMRLTFTFKNGKSPNPPPPVPPEIARPPLHNLASQYIPSWLDEDGKVRHLQRAEAAERLATQPARPPSILKLTHDEWLAKLRKEGWTLPTPPAE